MKKLHTLLSLHFALFTCIAHAQISGIINHYSAVTQIDSCTGKISVQDTSGFQAGHAVLLIQMQGAQIETNNNAAYGTLTALNSAGFFERAIIDSVGANTVFLQKRLLHSFAPAGKVQIVSIPSFTNVVVVDTLRARAWDGNTGGVLALEVSGTLTLNAPVTVNGAGFRGGANYIAPNNGCNWFTPITGYVYGLGNWRGGYKGEGIALLSAGQELGRGPQANGGGGGNDHNSGGGGGGNVSAGGDGGRNADPNPIGCNGNFPGFGGYANTAVFDRIFMGGGAGAGHANNLLRSKGGNGGGIVLIKAGAINGSTPMINAKGNDAGNSLDDGAGGGGAGGSIWLDLTVPNPNLVLNANGGKGGSADNNHVDRCMGPGGGGAGGRILTNAMTGILTVTGGDPGNTFNSTVGCNLSNNNAEAGSLGLIEALPVLPQGVEGIAPQIISHPVTLSICTGQNAAFSVVTSPGNWNYQWQVNAGSAWQDISTGSIYQGFLTDNLTLLNPNAFYEGLQFRCKVSRGGCSEIFSQTAVLHLISPPMASLNVSTNGTIASFSSSPTNATSFYWNFGDGAYSSLANPVHTYAAEGNYIVSLYAINSCDTVYYFLPLSILLPPTAEFSSPSTVFGCGTALVNFTNLSSANSSTFAWTFPGGSPGSSSLETPSVTYTNSGVYTAQLMVSNSVGQDTITHSFEVEIYQVPSAHFSSQILPGGLVHFTNQSQNGESYTWDFGDGSAQQSGFEFEHEYQTSGVYVVTLMVSSPCGVSIFQEEVTVMVVGTDEAPPLGALRIYPNPVSDWLNIDWSESRVQALEIQLLDASGHMLLSCKNPLGHSMTIPFEGFPAGVYQVRIKFETGERSGIILKTN